MIRNDQIQRAIMTYLKESTDMLGELSDNDEVREDQWQGREFSYPNYRLRLLNQPVPLHDCDDSVIEFQVQARSEESSSQKSDRMAGVAANYLHRKSFTRNDVRVYGVRVEEVIPAIREDDRTWRSEANCIGQVSSA